MPMSFKLPSLSRMLRAQKKFRRIAEKALKPASKPRRPRSAVAKTTLKEVSGFGSNPGRLTMKLYVPETKASKPALVVVLHGCRQTPESFDAASSFSKLARQRGFILLYPQQNTANNAQRCFNWFRPSAVARDRGELMSVRQMIDHACARHRVDQTRIFVAGLSAGGALASALAATYPERFAGVAIVAGMPVGAARDAMSALSAMRSGVARSSEHWEELMRVVSPHTAKWPPVSIWHGTWDNVVNPVNAQASVVQWLSVAGVDESAGRTLTKTWGKLTQWKHDGTTQVSLYSLAGFGHGFPVRRAASASRSASSDHYILDAGISAPLELLRIWGLKRQ